MTKSPVHPHLAPKVLFRRYKVNTEQKSKGITNKPCRRTCVDKDAAKTASNRNNSLKNMNILRKINYLILKKNVFLKQKIEQKNYQKNKL